MICEPTHISGFDLYLVFAGPPSSSALSPVPHLLGAALAAVRSQPSDTGDWAESQEKPRSFSVLQNSSEAVGDHNSRYVDQQQQQQQSDYYNNSSGALSPSIFDQFQPYSSEQQVSEGKRLSHSELSSFVT